MVILIDTLRADHLGVYGYSRPTSPNLDKFANENTRFDYAITACPWTPPSVASIFSGLYPASHGWMPPDNRNSLKHESTGLAPELKTIAEVLSSNGYFTGAVSSNPWISPEFNYDQGFEVYEIAPRAQASRVNKLAKDVIKKARASGKPFFTYLHYLDPHDSYDPPTVFRKYNDTPPGKHEYSPEMQKFLNLYDGEISYVDSELGQLFAYLKAEGLYDDLAIIVVADHGEQFQEHGDWRHGFQLFNEEVRVPLMIKRPGANVPTVVNSVVSTIDLFPTMLDFTQAKYDYDGPAISALKTELLEGRQGVMSEISRRYQQKAYIAQDRTKLIIGSKPIVTAQKASDQNEVTGDPTAIVGLFSAEQDLPVTDSARASSLALFLNETHQLALSKLVEQSTSRAKVKDTTLEQLKSLGYLQ